MLSTKLHHSYVPSFFKNLLFIYDMLALLQTKESVRFIYKYRAALLFLCDFLLEVG